MRYDRLSDARIANKSPQQIIFARIARLKRAAEFCRQSGWHAEAEQWTLRLREADAIAYLIEAHRECAELGGEPDDPGLDKFWQDVEWQRDREVRETLHAKRTLVYRVGIWWAKVWQHR